MTRERKLWIALGVAATLYFLARSDRGSAFVTDVLSSIPRGIRLNNPGNIRKSATTVWLGQLPIAQGKDPEFVEFVGPEYGIRAMARILKSYTSRGLVTIRQIVSQWAPPSENDTDAYIASVVQRTGFLADQALTPAQAMTLIPAIIFHENGQQPYSPSVIAQGVSLA